MWHHPRRGSGTGRSWVVGATSRVVECGTGFPSEVSLKLFHWHILGRQRGIRAKQVHCRHRSDMGPQEPRRLGKGGRDDTLQWRLHPAPGKSPWQCARRTRDGSPLPAKLGTEQEEDLIFWAGEHKPPGKGHGPQRHNKAGALLSQQWETGAWKLVPTWRRPSFCLQGNKVKSAIPRELGAVKTSLVSRCQLAQNISWTHGGCRMTGHCRDEQLGRSRALSASVQNWGSGGNYCTTGPCLFTRLGCLAGCQICAAAVSSFLLLVRDGTHRPGGCFCDFLKRKHKVESSTALVHSQGSASQIPRAGGEEGLGVIFSMK